MAIYTGSPLGIVSDFFQGGESNAYSSYSQKLSIGNVTSKTEIESSDSFFSSGHKFIRKNSTEGGLSIDPLSFGSPSKIHDSDIYDISTTNIVKILSGYDTMKLKTSDFVYCRDYGVYPNNRMVVCRRFPNPIGDDLTVSNLPSPNVSLVSWFSDQENPISFEFGEKWIESDPSLKKVLNDIGKDVLTKGVGDNASRFVDAVPLPGITELMQREILQNIGIISADASVIPSGDPNLIIEAKQRALTSVESGGSGLKGKFSIKVKCSWEQKFISGVDPTFIYYDILRTILEFGGSESTFFLGKNGVINGQDDIQGGLSKLQNNPLGFVSDYIQAIIDSIGEFSKNFKNQVKDISGGTPEDDSLKSIVEGVKGGVDLSASRITNFIRLLPETIAKKYKIPLLGIVSSLTGAPSGFWHITVGNPMRPTLCSGDMICESVSVSLGPSLSFNDLPSTISCEFTMESARNLGIDEIFTKLSSGYLRVVDGSDGKLYKVSSTKSPISYTNSDDVITKETQQRGPLNKISQESSSIDEEEKSNNEVDSDQDTTKVGNAFSSESGDLIMSDPNSIYGYTTTEDDRFNEIGQIRSNKKLPFI